MADVPIILGLTPIPFIFLLSIGLSLLVSLIYKYTTDQALMKELKSDMKKCQAKMKEHKGDNEKMMEYQKKIMTCNSKYMMSSLKPMIFTLVPFLLIFHVLRKIYAGTVVVPLNFHVPLSALETGLGWIGVYIIFSMIFTTLFRKLLKVS